jgi:hypothetical protein
MEVCYSHYKCEFRRNGLQIRSSGGNMVKSKEKNIYAQIIKKKKLSNDDLYTILKLRDKLLVSDFFFEYKYLSQENFVVLEEYINKNLGHRNKLFVSDLIEMATDFNLHLETKKCLLILRKLKNDNHYVAIATIVYLFTNFRSSRIRDIVTSLNSILKSKEAKLVAKIFAAFYLFRITYNLKYFKKLEVYILKDNSNNELLFNLLSDEFNTKEFFAGHDLLQLLLKK